MKNRVPFLLLSLLIVMSVLLGACTSNAQPANEPAVSDAAQVEQPAADVEEASAEEPVTIKVISFLTYDENKEGAEAAVVAAFQEAHPEIVVDFQLLPYADYFTSLKTWIAGGTDCRTRA